MLVFHNPGELDPQFLRLMGASVKSAGAFGRFGTGLKYGVATILRGGGTIRLFVGEKEYGFGTLAREVRDASFCEAVLFSKETGAEQPLGFTTALGKDWLPWMAFREFACNARDDGGDFFHTLQDLPECFAPAKDQTLFMVEWPELEAEAEQIAQELFLQGEPIEEAAGVAIHPGPSQFVYHRGVRVMKLPKEAAFAYNVTGRMDLTEDRTAKYEFIVRADIRRALLSVQDRGIIAGSVTNSSGWEGSSKLWTDNSWREPEPSIQWLDEVGSLRERAKYQLSAGVSELYLKHVAIQEGRSYGGYYHDSDMPRNLEWTLNELRDIDLEAEDIFLVKELPGGQMSMMMNGNIYITQALLDERPSRIATELVRRNFEATAQGDHDALLDLVVPLIVKHSDRLARDWELWEEEQRTAEVVAKETVDEPG